MKLSEASFLVYSIYLKNPDRVYEKRFMQAGERWHKQLEQEKEELQGRTEVILRSVLSPYRVELFINDT